MHRPTLRFVAVTAFAVDVAHAYTTFPVSATSSRRDVSTSRSVAMTPPPEDFLLSSLVEQQVLVVAPNDQVDFSLSKEQAQPIVRVGSGDKEKIINAFGLWCGAVSIVTGFIWMVAMSLVDATIHQRGDMVDPHRAIFDSTGKVWAKVWLSMTGCYPTITGNVQQIQDKEENTACLYVANHASWLDIPVLCTVLDPVFKFIAKGELANFPCIGQQLHGGKHILIDREDRRSQLKTFKEGMEYLRQGVPLMAFPEGKRSPDGRLMAFKRGLFSLASKAQVPIIPITISNTAAVMPSYSYLPVQSGRGKIHVHIGEAIHPEGKTEAELEALVRAEFLDKLPASQHPIYRKNEAAIAAAVTRELETVS